MFSCLPNGSPAPKVYRCFESIVKCYPKAGILCFSPSFVFRRLLLCILRLYGISLLFWTNSGQFPCYLGVIWWIKKRKEKKGRLSPFAEHSTSPPAVQNRTPCGEKRDRSGHRPHLLQVYIYPRWNDHAVHVRSCQIVSISPKWERPTKKGSIGCLRLLFIHRRPRIIT